MIVSRTFYRSKVCIPTISEYGPFSHVTSKYLYNISSSSKFSYFLSLSSTSDAFTVAVMPWLFYVRMGQVWLHSQFLECVLTHSYWHGSSVAALIVSGVILDSFIFAWSWCGCTHSFWSMFWLIHICMELVWLHSHFLEYVLTHSYLHGAGMAALTVSWVCFDSFIFAWSWCGCTHSFWSMFWLIHICMELVWLHSQFLEYVLTHSYLHGAGVAALTVSGVCFDSFIFAWSWCGCTHSFWSMFWLIHICMELVWLHSQFLEYVLTHSYLHGAGVAALIVSGVCFDSFIFPWSRCGCTHSFWSMFWLIHIGMELVWLHS